MCLFAFFSDLWQQSSHPKQRPIYDGRNDSYGPALTLFTCISLVCTTRFTLRAFGYGITMMDYNTHLYSVRLREVIYCQMFNTLRAKANYKKIEAIDISSITSNGELSACRHDTWEDESIGMSDSIHAQTKTGRDNFNGNTRPPSYLLLLTLF